MSSEQKTANTVITSEQIALLFHDLSGPVTNAKHFQAEVDLALSQLCEILASAENRLGPQETQAIDKVLSQDLMPCTEFVSKSIKLLESRIDEHGKLAT